MEAPNNPATDLIRSVAQFVPWRMKIEEDNIKAVSFTYEYGMAYSQIFRENKIQGGVCFPISVLKANQVWITGIKTGEFERLALNEQIDDHSLGIKRQDFIGRETGQSITLRNSLKISVGFSGFRAVRDLEIVVRGINKENESDGRL